MNEKAKRLVKIVTIHSQKGGVGKTSLALAKAGWFNLKEGKKTLIIDGDITGTSLFDVLGAGTSKRFLNDLLLADPMLFHEYQQSPQKAQADFCVLVEDTNIYYIPSSSSLADVRTIVPLISQEDKLHFFQSRMEDIIQIFVNEGFEAIILDNPPGLFGMSQATLSLAMVAPDIVYEKCPIFMASADRADYRALFLSLTAILEQRCDNVSILFNRLPLGRYRDPAFKLQEIMNDLKKFQGVDKVLLDKVKVATLASDFDISQIILTIKKISQQSEKEKDPGPLEKWCEEIGKNL